MYELLFSIERYADLRFADEDGAGWAAISSQVQSKTNPLRPAPLFTIPRDLEIIVSVERQPYSKANAKTHRDIVLHAPIATLLPARVKMNNAWADNAKLRPSCKEIEERLKAMIAKERWSRKHQDTTIQVHDRFTDTDDGVFDAGVFDMARKTMMGPVEALKVASKFTSLLWSQLQNDFDADLANNLFVEHCSIKAVDPIFQTLFEDSKGSACLRRLADLMFVNRADVHYEYEPTLEDVS